MKKLTTVFLLLPAFLLTFSAPVFSYQEIDVMNGGTIKGKTSLTGRSPFPRVYHLVLFPNMDMCAEVSPDDEVSTDLDNMNRILNDFVVGPNGELKDVVVTLEHVEAGKPFDSRPLDILAEGCTFYPYVSVIRQGGKFTVDNQDAVMHNSQVYQKERGKIILNIPIPAEEVSAGEVRFQKNFKLMQMICGMHEFMQTWGYRIQNPYYFITKNDGSFKIDNIPPGEYVVNAWHSLTKSQSKKITIKENSVVDLDFEFNGDMVIRPLYETIQSGRIKKDAKPHKRNPNKF